MHRTVVQCTVNKAKVFPFLDRFYYCVIMCDHRINYIQGYLIILTIKKVQ